MLEFKKKELKFKYDEKEHCVRFPSIKDLSEYQKNYKEIGEDNAVEAVLGFLVKLGLEKEVAESLETPHVEAIMKELTEVKKN